MSCSLNEIDALGKRAARGAGLSWGMSEEAGKAVRWLASHKISGAKALADILDHNDEVLSSELAPMSLEGVWAAPSGQLCPLASGAALNDCASRLLAGEAIEMENVSHPVLVVPFAAWAALQINAPITVSWQNVRVDTDGYAIWLDDPDNQVGVATPVSLVCHRADGRDDVATQPALRGNVSSLSWTRLNAYAHRTYAPATAESRLLGAGAGVTDND